MKRLIAGVVGIVFITLGIRYPSQPNTAVRVPDKFIIYVAGKGLNGSGFSDQTCDKPNQQLSACAMARGVHAAYTSNQFKKFTSFIEYQEVDDHGSADEAESVALHLGTDPRVLAVIGHSYSDTTQKAAIKYAAAKIPLLIPIATSPNVGYDSWQPFWNLEASTKQHLPNVFRLIPNDKIGQAPSIAHVVTKLRASKALTSYAILADLSDNKQYTQGLEAELHQKLPDAQTGEINEACKDYTALPQSCLHWNTQGPPSLELLIFLGTGKSTDRFLKLAVLERNSTLSALKFIVMADGSKNVDPETLQQVVHTNIPLLLTFPTKQIAAQNLAVDFKPLKDALPPNNIQSYEEYGFDSLLLIAKALEPLYSSQKQISRGALIQQLSETTALQGATNLFIFHEGENVHPDYGIYGAASDAQLDDVQKTVCEQRHFAPAPDNAAADLRYLCYVGFDEVNFR